MGLFVESLSHIGNVVWNVGTCPDTLSCKTTEKSCVFCLSLPHHSLSLGIAAISCSTRLLHTQLTQRSKLMCIEMQNHVTVITYQKYRLWKHFLAIFCLF